MDSKLGLSRDIRYNTRVTGARFDEAKRRWQVDTENGPGASAQFLVLCTGIGSKPHTPDIPGLGDFGGRCLHTARWPQEGVDLKGISIGVLGTGATGVQVIQEAGPDAAHLTVFQRTPNMALPMRQRRLDEAGKRALKANMTERYAKRARTRGGYDFDYLDYAGPTCAGMRNDEILALWEKHWEEGGFVPWLGNFPEIYTDERINLMAYEFWRDKVRQRLTDPVMAEKLAPTKPPHPYGVKRISLEQRFYEVFNQTNVTLVDLNETPIVQMVKNGVETLGGRIHELDLLVLATGFDMVTGGLTAMDIVSTDGVSLRDRWRHGVSAHMGSMTHGYPNMFFVYGPLAPSGLSNGPSCSELQGDEIVELVNYMREHGKQRIESSARADQAWRQRIDEFAAGTLFGKAQSWYMANNVPGKAAQMINYPIGMPDYLEQWKLVKADKYRGFELH